MDPIASGTPIEAQVSASGARIGFQLSVSPVGYQAHMIEGRAVPPSVRGSGLVDTGTTMSLVSGAVAEALSLDVLHSVRVHTALGSAMAPCYATEFRFVGPSVARAEPLALVVATAPDLREDMVIGLDVLRRCRLA